MKDFNKGLYVGLAVGSALITLLALLFINFFPDVILDNGFIITLFSLFSFSALVLYKSFDFKDCKGCYGGDSQELKLSEATEIIIDYSGKSEFHNPIASSIRSLNWGDEKVDKIVKREAYLLHFCSEQYCNIALEKILENGLIPATITELSFYPEVLPDGKIIALGSLLRDELAQIEITPSLNKDRVINKTWFKAKCFKEDRFLVFKDDGIPIEITNKEFE